MDPTAALLATVFLGIVVRVLGNFQYLFIFQGSSPYVFYFLSFVFYSYSFGSNNILRVLFCFLVLFIVLQIYLSSFLGKESGDKLWIMLATQLIEARARQEGRVSLYNWIVYKQGSKARERKGEERKYRLKLCTILQSRDGNLPSRDGNLRQFAAMCQRRNTKAYKALMANP